ncbi:hypothetical protein DAEQUDRAFT_757429 [Daedalea quercina L-15889]|uniref:Uncharacterized protein n=1 Tax=Daedalea quercina L-15889 TaxID=1314783 RepID=A0A165PWD2_9APHY|nr:hypothetical protein DAEQUDRAFT_757429 [Daedalea quercina L-15889]
MRTTTVISVLALAAVANAAGGKGKGKGKGLNIEKALNHVEHAAGAAQAVGDAVSSFRSNRRRSSGYDDIYARYDDDELYARDFADDLYAREFDDELYAREYDDAHWARGDFEELFARVNEANPDGAAQAPTSPASEEHRHKATPGEGKTGKKTGYEKHAHPNGEPVNEPAAHHEKQAGSHGEHHRTTHSGAQAGVQHPAHGGDSAQPKTPGAPAEKLNRRELLDYLLARAIEELD